MEHKVTSIEDGLLEKEDCLTLEQGQFGGEARDQMRFGFLERLGVVGTRLRRFSSRNKRKLLREKVVEKKEGD